MTKFIAIVSFIFPVLAAGCSSPQAQSGPPVFPPVPVATTQAVEESVPIQLRSVGTAEAYSTVEVKSQVAGPLLNVKFAEGANVNRGDLLFEIDSRPFRDGRFRLAKGFTKWTRRSCVVRRPISRVAR